MRRRWTPYKKKIADLEAELAKLRMPKIPLCSEEQLKAVSDKAMHTGMERDLVAALHMGRHQWRGRRCGKGGRGTTRGGVDNPVPDCDHTSATTNHATRAHGTHGSYGPPAGDPHFPGGPPGTIPANGTHAPWPTRGVLQLRNVRAVVQKLFDGGPHPKTTHHTNAATTRSAVAAGHTGATGPHSPSFSGLSPPPPLYGGFTQVGAQTIYTAHTTGRQYDASGPPPYPYSRCHGNHWSWQPCPAQQPGMPPQPQPQPQPQSQPQQWRKRTGRAKRHTGQPWRKVRHSNPATPPSHLPGCTHSRGRGDRTGALVVKARAEGTTQNWRRDLQRVGRTLLIYSDLDAPSALAKHLTMVAAQGRQSATLRGIVSSVRICETLGIVDTVVTPLQWAICKAANRAYAHTPPRRMWATAHTLQDWTHVPRGRLEQQSSRCPVWGQPCAGASMRPLQCDQQTWRHPGEWPSMTRRPNAGGPRHGSATGARLGENAYAPLLSTGRVGTHYSPRPLKSSTPHESHSWAQCGTQSPGTPFAGWGQRHWLPRGQPWRSQPGGEGGSPNAKRQSTPRPRLTGSGNSLPCSPVQHPEVESRYAQRRRLKCGQWQSWVVRPPRERKTRRPYQSSYPTLGTTTTTGYWGPLCRVMEYAPDEATANSQEPTRDLPVGRAAPQVQRRTVRVRLRTRCALRRRPPAGGRKCQGQQSVEDPPPEMSPPGVRQVRRRTPSAHAGSSR